MARFMLVTYAPADFDQAAFEADRGAPEMSALVSFMHRLNADLAERGELVVAEGLTGASDARVVRPAGEGGTEVVEGPFEPGGHLMIGWWLLELDGLARAQEIAAMVAGFVQAPIEIRPVGQAPQV